jgi:hypothetical protein
MSNQLINNTNNTCTHTSVAGPAQPVGPAQPAQPAGSAIDFGLETSATRENFPTADQFKRMCTRINFNRVLDMVKHKLFHANTCNQTFIRVMHPDTISFPTDSVNDVKTFLVSQGFTIVEIEDGVGVSQGWKLTW